MEAFAGKAKLLRVIGSEKGVSDAFLGAVFVGVCPVFLDILCVCVSRLCNRREPEIYCGRGTRPYRDGTTGGRWTLLDTGTRDKGGKMPPYSRKG